MGFVFTVVSFCLLAGGVKVTSAVVWKSANDLADNVTLAVCEGQNVLLHWRYTPQPAEHLKDDEWHFVQDGGDTDTLLATRVHGQFIPEAGNAVQLEFVPNAGIRLLNVSVQDSGAYFVKATFNVHGSLVTYTQTANVHVTSNAGVVKNGHLVASIQPGGRYDNQTTEYHLVLACSQINEPWRDSAHISWTTPDHKVIGTSWWRSGVAYLSVPNPVTSGDYTCNLDQASAADSTCLPANSPSSGGATVHVDAVEARLSLLEAEVLGMRSRESELQGKVDSLKAENQALKQQLEFTSPSIGFDVSLQTLTTSDSPLIFTDISTNEGGAFHAASAKFVAPVNGTYVFHLTLVSSNPNVDDSRVTVFLVVDGRKMVSAMTSRVTGYYNTGSVDLVQPMVQGQQVWVTNNSTGQRHFTFSVHLSGFLLKPGF